MRSGLSSTEWIYTNKALNVIIRTHKIEIGEYKYATSKTSPLLNNGKEMMVAIYKDQATAKTGHFGYIELETKINGAAIRSQFSPVKALTHDDVINNTPR